jgi:hypothetical protein
MEIDLKTDLVSVHDKLAREIDLLTKRLARDGKELEKAKALFQHIRGLLATDETGSDKAESKRSVRSLTLELVSTIETPFTTTDAWLAWKRYYPDQEIKQSRISSALWKLADDKAIRVISKGTGGKDLPRYERLNGAVKATKEGMISPK